MDGPDESKSVKADGPKDLKSESGRSKSAKVVDLKIFNSESERSGSIKAGGPDI